MKAVALSLALLAAGQPALAAETQPIPALIQAAKRNCVACVNALLAGGAEIDARSRPGGDTALHAAATADSPELVEALIARGADPSPVNLRGDSPLHVAARRSSPATVKALLARGADVDAWSGDGTPLMAAVRGTRAGARYSNVVILLGAKANPNVADRLGDTPLHVAVASGDARLVAALLRAGARVDATNARGETPAALAERLNRVDALNAIRASVRRPL